MTSSKRISFVMTFYILLIMVSRFESSSALTVTAEAIDGSPGGYHFISFNAWALPVWLPGAAQIKRYKKIPKQLLNRNADIICVQEAFARKIRKKLLPKLEGKYHTFSDYYCSKTIFGPFAKDCHGGLITFSRWPIIDEVFYPYPIISTMRIEERIGAKGFLLTTIDAPDGVINVINTHLYAGGKDSDERHRMLQIQHMDSIISSRDDLQCQPLFLLGDLNVLHPDIATESNQPYSPVYDYVTDHMNFFDPAASLSVGQYTMNADTNPYCKNKGGAEKLDYCMYRKADQTTITLRDQKVIFTGDEAISDHLGWEATFSITETIESNEPLISPSEEPAVIVAAEEK